MAINMNRRRRRLDIEVSGRSSDTELLQCVVQALQDPDLDIVERVLVDVTALASYQVKAAVRLDIHAHLAGLFRTREALRIAVLYTDLAVGELGQFVA